MRSPSAISLASLEDFSGHEWVAECMIECRKRRRLASQALRQLTEDLGEINEGFKQGRGHGYLAFTTVGSRVKKPDSFLRKLYNRCRANSPKKGMTREFLNVQADGIHDIAGARLACAYFDNVIPRVKFVRHELSVRGYAVDLASEGLPDKNLLEDGDEQGYRSYHFHVKIPTRVSIYGDTEMCVCEMQARSELQQVWADKSHDLLYKPDEGWMWSDENVLEDMKQVSNGLRMIDGLLVSLRERARSGAPGRTQGTG